MTVVEPAAADHRASGPRISDPGQRHASPIHCSHPAFRVAFSGDRRRDRVKRSDVICRQRDADRAGVLLDAFRARRAGDRNDVGPAREQPREGPQTPRVIGYVANNTVRVELRQLDQVGVVIDAALAAGANMVNTIQFFASNVDAARRTALAEAVGRARADAEALARAAGGSLGALLELNTQSPPVRPVYAERLMRMDAAGVGAAQTPIEPGQQTLTVWVGGRWAFVPGGSR